MGAEKSLTPVDLVKRSAASPEMIAFLWAAVENGRSVIVCGDKDTGRTSTLNAAALFIRPDARIVSVESRRELALPHRQWNALTTRDGDPSKGIPAEEEAAALVHLSEALRQRADCILVGDLRRAEAFPVFAAMISGVPTMTTFEADSVKDLVNRLEDPPFNIPRIVFTAIHLVLIQAREDAGGTPRRRTTKVVEVVGYEPKTNELITNTVFQWEPKSGQFTFKGHSFLYDEIAEKKGIDGEAVQKDMQRRVDVVNYMVKKGVADSKEIHDLVASYRQDAVGTWRRVVEVDMPPAGARGDFPPVERIK